MKRILFILVIAILFSAVGAFGQDYPALDKAAQQKADSICKIRGHIVDQWTPAGLDFSKILDLPSATVRVRYHRTDFVEAVCSRCDRIISKAGTTRPDTTLIWKAK